METNKEVKRNYLIETVIAHPATQIVFWLQFAIAVSVFSYMTTAPLVLPPGDVDTVLHFIGNFLMFMSARVAFIRFKSNVFVLVFVLLYGTAMEVIQNFIPARTFDPQDLLANWSGVFAGLGFAVLVEVIYKKLCKAK